MLVSLREENGIAERPFIVWEPFPASCRPENRAGILEACKYVDVFSPNHLEFLSLFESTNTPAFDKVEMEDRALNFAKKTRAGVVVIRCGETGSLTITPDGERIWILPYYTHGTKEVVDATGAGNAFLGGFTAGWMRTQNVREASMYGSVASSFAIEQIGLPTLSCEEDLEVWNGVRVRERVEEYKRRVEVVGKEKWI